MSVPAGTPANSSLLSSPDIQFLLTFGAGMGAFWLSANLPGYLPPIRLAHNLLATFALNLALALIIYGLIMAIWAWLILGRRRSIKAALIAGGLATGLALATSLTLTWMAARHINLPLAVLAFSLYLVYGLYFVIGWAVATRLSRVSN